MKIKTLFQLTFFILIIFSCNESDNDCSTYKDAYSSLVNSYQKILKERDSLSQVVPDTIWYLPQCTLCYESIDSINGEQYYIGYDGKYYKLFQETDTLIKQVFVNWIDTTITRYRFVDSLVYFDSLVVNHFGENVIWGHSDFERFLDGDTCSNTVVFGTIFKQSSESHPEITSIYIDGYYFDDGITIYPDLKFYVNDIYLDKLKGSKGGYVGIIDQPIDSINSIMIEPILDEDLEDLFIKTIKLNKTVLNHPNGWNITVEDSIEYLGFSVFLMKHESRIEFRKP